MADDDKRKQSDQVNKKSPPRLVKLNGKSDEVYDSYGYRIEKSKPAAQPPKREQKDGQRRRAVDNAPSKTPQKQQKSLYAGSQPAKPKSQTPAPMQRSSQKMDMPSHEKRISERAPRKRKALYSMLKVGVFVVIAALIIVIILYNKDEKENAIKTAFLSTGTIENSITADVNIIRDEYNVLAGYSGKLITNVNEGDRVAVGTVIAYVVKPEYENDLNKLRDIEDKIATAQNASSYVNTSQTSQIGTLNTNILKLTFELSKMSGTPSGIRHYSEVIKELNSQFQMKNDIMMNSETADAYITTLQAQRAEIMNKLGASMYEIKAQQAGVISFYTDLEEQNASAKAKEISTYISKKGGADNILSENALTFNTSELKNKIGTSVTDSDIVARITPDVTYYLTADVTNCNYSGLSEGKKVSVKASGREFTVDATVVELKRYGDKTYALLQSSTGIAGTISKRIVKSDIIIDYSEGIKVPKRALAEWDAAGVTARIAIVRSNYVSFVYVTVLAVDSEYAIINNSNGFTSPEDQGITSVRINDLYVVNCEKVTDGQIIGG